MKAQPCKSIRNVANTFFQLTRSSFSSGLGALFAYESQMNETNAFCTLFLNEFVLFIKLGCSELERSNVQEVHATIELRFPKPPNGLLTDSLEGTICYAKIAESVRRKCESREYNLIEKIAYDVYCVTREITTSSFAIAVSIKKAHPPVEGLLGGACFRFGDFAT